MISKVPVTAVIPTYNGRALLEAHVPTVLQNLRASDELLIIDDAGSDDSLVWAEKEFKLQPGLARQDFALWRGEASLSSKKIVVTYVRNHTNLRFAASCNRAVQLAQHDWILLLNNDVAPFKDCLAHLLPYTNQSDLFAVGCLELEGPNQTLGGRNRLWFARGLFVHARAETYVTGETAWVSGGSGLFNKAKWLELAGFDEAYYPAYWEDVDLSFRARQRGWKVWFSAEAKVNHNHETTNSSVFGQQKIALISLRNAFIFAWKNGSFKQRVQTVCWLPYHAIFTTFRLLKAVR